MRALVICILAIAATACASAPKTEQAATGAAPAAASQDLTGEKLMAAQAAGYEIKDVNGEKMYCRREMQTGSHARYKTACMTQREWEQLAQISRQRVQDAARQRLPPPSN